MRFHRLMRFPPPHLISAPSPNWVKTARINPGFQSENIANYPEKPISSKIGMILFWDLWRPVSMKALQLCQVHSKNETPV